MWYSTSPRNPSPLYSAYTYLIAAVHSEVREASSRPPPVGALLGHLRLVPDVDADADQEERELRLDKHPGHLRPSQEDVVRPLERDTGLLVVVVWSRRRP